MVVIKDPDGPSLRITEDGHALTTSTIITEIEHASEESLSAYSWSSGTFDPGVNDTILLVQNNSITDLHIVSVACSTYVDTIVTIHRPNVTFAIASATQITGVNLNSNGTNILSTDTTVVDARQNETGNAIGDIFWRGEISTASGTYTRFMPGVILGRGKSIAVDYLADTGVVGVTIIGHF